MSEIEILPLRLARLTLPDWHPEGPGPCDVQAFAIREQGSVVLVDTGVGRSSSLINRLYSPERTEFEVALASHGIRISDVAALINSHLHFDHCGNNHLFPGVPIFVQRVDLEASRAADDGSSAWVEFDGSNYVHVDGAASVSGQIRVVPSPGHTPGHQSVCVESAQDLQIIVAQAAYTAAEFAAVEAGDFSGVTTNSYDDHAYVESLKRLYGLAPSRAFFSHDEAIWEGAA